MDRRYEKPIAPSRDRSGLKGLLVIVGLLCSALLLSEADCLKTQRQPDGRVYRIMQSGQYSQPYQSQ